MKIRPVLLALVIVAISFAISLKAMDWLSQQATVKAPVLAQLPPLPQTTRRSTILAPIAISLGAIRDAAERGTPRNFSGKANNPVSQILENADIGWTASRGSITAAGAQDMLTLTTPLTGTLHVMGSLSAKATGALGNALGGLLGDNVAKQVGSVNIKNVNANADIKGNVVLTARPKITTDWHVDPNLNGQVNLGDSSLIVAGARLSVPAQVKPVIDKAVADQIANVQARLRNDPTLERAARQQWTKACRSIPLPGAGGASSPPLWLELRPLRALAAQPTLDSANMTLTLGIEAETRITSAETRPDCPFPSSVTFVPATPGVSIGIPIDIPFTDLSGIINSQLAGRTFPEGGGAVGVTVKRATVAASGDRLLISLLLDASANKGFFGLGGEAEVHIWGRPVLDQAQQTLRLTDIQLAVESEAAFGLLGAAARAAIPHLQNALVEKASIDLKPFAASARKKIADTITDLQKSGSNGVQVTANVNSLRLTDVAFDSKTMRVIADAQGAINVTVTALPGP